MTNDEILKAAHSLIELSSAFSEEYSRAQVELRDIHAESERRRIQVQSRRRDRVDSNQRYVRPEGEGERKEEVSRGEEEKTGRIIQTIFGKTERDSSDGDGRLGRVIQASGGRDRISSGDSCDSQVDSRENQDSGAGSGRFEKGSSEQSGFISEGNPEQPRIVQDGTSVGCGSKTGCCSGEVQPSGRDTEQSKNFVRISLGENAQGVSSFVAVEADCCGVSGESAGGYDSDFDSGTYVGSTGFSRGRCRKSSQSNSRQWVEVIILAIIFVMAFAVASFAIQWI